MSSLQPCPARWVSQPGPAADELECRANAIRVVIDDLGDRVADARQRLGRLTAEVRRLDAEASAQQAAEQLWRRRALACPEGDDVQAMQCLQQAHRHAAQCAQAQRNARACRDQAESETGELRAAQRRLAAVVSRLARLRGPQAEFGRGLRA